MSNDKRSVSCENCKTTNVDNDKNLETVVCKPDVSMLGEPTRKADAVLVVEGVRIPVIKIQGFITVYFVLTNIINH